MSNNVSLLNYLNCFLLVIIHYFIAVPGTSVGMSNILSDKSFSSLESHVSEATMKGIAEMGFTHMTDIQVENAKCFLVPLRVFPLK